MTPWIQPDLSDDPDVWDNVEAVTVTSRRNFPVLYSGGILQSGVANNLQSVATTAKRRGLSKKELAASGGAYLALDRNWLIKRKSMPFDLKPGDIVTDRQGTNWTILEPSLNTWASWWNCVSRDPIIAYDLQQQLQFWTPINTQDATGNRVPRLGYSRIAADGSVTYAVYYTLAGSISATATTFAPAYVPAIQNLTPHTPFGVQIDSEIMLVTSVDPNTFIWTVQRGQAQTVATTHTIGTAITLPPLTVAGKIQPMGGTVEDNFSKHAIRQTFTGFLSQQVAVTNEMQLTVAFDPTCAIYQIKGFSNPQRIDELMRLDLEIIP